MHAVDGLSFEVGAGETVGDRRGVGLWQEHGRMSIMRLLPQRAYIAGGRVELNGRDLIELSDDEIRKVRGNEIGMVFQDPMTSLNPTMTIGKQIAESVLIHRDVTKAEAMDRAAEVLGLVGLPKPSERLKDYPHQLSGGLRQRVMIAMALACEPKLLIADEPTTALDVTIQAQILRLLDKIKQDLGMGIILITHDMGVIAGRADRVVVMYAGQKVETARTSSSSAACATLTRRLCLRRFRGSIRTRLRRFTRSPVSRRSPDPPPACRFVARCAFATDECRTAPPALVATTPRTSSRVTTPGTWPAVTSAPLRQRCCWRVNATLSSPRPSGPSLSCSHR